MTNANINIHVYRGHELKCACMISQCDYTLNTYTHVT